MPKVFVGFRAAGALDAELLKVRTELSRMQRVGCYEQSQAEPRGYKEHALWRERPNGGHEPEAAVNGRQQ